MSIEYNRAKRDKKEKKEKEKEAKSKWYNDPCHKLFSQENVCAISMTQYAFARKIMNIAIPYSLESESPLAKLYMKLKA